MMKLLFSEPQIIDRFTFKNLTPIVQQQLEIVGEIIMDESDPAKIFAQCEAEKRIWELYNVVDSHETPLFDAWVLGKESGYLFEYASIKETPFVLVNASFRDTREEGEDYEESRKWITALNKAFRDAPHLDDQAGAKEKYWADFARKNPAESVV